MKKILFLLLLTGLLIIPTGCFYETVPASTDASDEQSSSSEKSPQKNQGDSESKSETKDNQKETLENRTRKVDTENTYVFDESMILDDSEFEALNSYTAWLAKAFKINAAIVLTDDIGESEPAEFAKKFYESKYSGDGVLLLINNDTNNDFFYRHGTPADFISDSDVQMLFSEISPMLVLEDYVTAAETVLEEVELSVPEHFTDRTGELKPEEIKKLSNIIKDKCHENTINIYYVYGIGEEGTEEFAKKRFKMYYDSDEDAAMLVIDSANGESSLCASGNLEYLTESKADITAAVKACYTKEKGMNAEKAVEKFIEFVE